MTDLRRVAAACNGLSFRVYAEAVKSAAGNFAMGTFNVASAVAAAWPAAGGRTAAEISETFDGMDEEKFFSALRCLVTAPRPEGVELLHHTRLWCSDGAEFRAEYLEHSRQLLRATAERLAFADTTAAAARINAAVAKDTQGRIENLVSASLLDPDSQLVITAAASFDASWSSPFEDCNTTVRPFTLATGQTIPVPMMRQQSRFSVRIEPGYRLLTLAYGGDTFIEPGDELPVPIVMQIILPDSADGLDRVEAKIIAEDSLAGAKAGAFEDVIVTLPKFAFSSRASLTQPLVTAGLATFFDPACSDFTRAIDGPGRIVASSCVHETRIEVEETGTRAAAATAIVHSRSAALEPPRPPMEFTVDRPFLFLIREAKTGLAHFLGRVTDPTADG